MSYGQPPAAAMTARAAPLGGLAKLYLVHGDEAQREAAAALLEQELGAGYRRREPTDENAAVPSLDVVPTMKSRTCVFGGFAI